jgi:hypothetical protein
VLGMISRRLWWHVVRNDKRGSEEGLLATHVTAYFSNDVRGSLGPVFDQRSNKESRNCHE